MKSDYKSSPSALVFSCGGLCFNSEHPWAMLKWLGTYWTSLWDFRRPSTFPVNAGTRIILRALTLSSSVMLLLTLFGSFEKWVYAHKNLTGRVIIVLTLKEMNNTAIHFHNFSQYMLHTFSRTTPLNICSAISKRNCRSFLRRFLVPKYH